MTERGERHVLGAALTDGSARPTVLADDVYLGGERNQGRGTAGKTRMIGACRAIATSTALTRKDRLRPGRRGEWLMGGKAIDASLSDSLLLLFSHFPEGVLTVRYGMTGFANGIFLDLFGLNAADVIGAPLRDVLERIRIAPKAVDLLTATNAIGVFSDVLCDGDQRRIFRVHRFRIDDAAPPPPSHDDADYAGLDAVMFIDDTLWREAQRTSEILVQQLLRADRHAALGEMAMALAHEINQPLGAIINFAGAARNTLKGRTVRIDELDELLQNIGAEAARAGDVIKSLRSFLRDKPLTAHSADVNAAVKVVLGFAEPATREHSIAAQLVLANDLPLVQADQIILQQIVLNLVANAVQAMQNQPLHLRQLVITTFIEGDNLVVITVRDTGVGLPRDLGETIFEPFVTTRENGSGLGLSIARTMVQRLGGSIEALPAESYGGACFTVRLPCHSVKAQPHA